MAILPVTQDDVEFFTSLVNPSRYYSSSSLGVTGSLSLFSRNSHIEKEVRPLTNFSASFTNDQDIETFRGAVIRVAGTTQLSGSFNELMDDYLFKVNQQSESEKKKKKINIIRFTPSVTFTSNTIRKLNIKNSLMPYYRSSYPTAQWGYTNYHSLNFFKSTSVPTSSVLLYPNIDNKKIPVHDGYVSGTYSLSGAFSFDFYINPRRKIDGTDSSHFKAGTIFHLSSSYCLSLVSGSIKDENGLPTSFRLQLQLSHSADIPPSKAIKGSYPNDLVFLSDDNSLNWNEWNRIVVRWGTSIINDGTGSFNVNGVDKGVFVVPSGTIMPKIFTTKDDPRVLCVGNYYEGTNSGDESLAYFFSEIPSEREGIEELVNNGGTKDQPDAYKFNHLLNAELHDLMIRRHYMTDLEISQSFGKGPGSISEDIAFYLPPLFVEKTNIRRQAPAPSLGGSAYGGILQTPFFEIDGSTDDPFNVAMSFGVNGHYINLENFTKDFATGLFPRLHHMSGTAIDYTTQAKEANEFLYDDSFVRVRNLFILPCDDGVFSPNYNLITSSVSNKYFDVFKRFDPSVISLENLLSTSSILFGSTHDAEHDETFIEQLIGFSPEYPGLQPGSAVVNKKNEIENIISTDENSYGPGVQRGVPLTIYQRTKDSSSNQVTIFDISNLYYGSKILPGTFKITDSNMTGSGGSVSITLKDDGFGNMYRADSFTPHSTWNSVGNIFYNEGIVLIKSPHLYFFGKNQYEMSFKGEYQLHTSKYEILAPSGLLNSSSNPSFARAENFLSASADIDDNDKFVYISNVNLHDENLNVVAKAVLAQPVIKREGEKLLFKIAFDF